MNYCVYEHINKINNKKYIGITCKTPKSRWNNGNGYKKTTHFGKAILKYGWNNFEHKILFTNLTNEEAEEKERELIKKYKSNINECGYNNSIGGEHTNIGSKFSEETKQKMSIAKKGNKYFLNKNHSIETKMKLSKPVVCIETQIEYFGIREASRQTNIHRDSIQRCCNNKRKTAGNFHWKYKEV
jgi:group I intron endonuclease